MIRIRTLYLVAGFLLPSLMVAVIGCSDDNDPTGPNPGPGHNTPVGIPTPANDVSLSPILYWHPTGTYGDSVVYDLYFGAGATPSPTYSNLADTSHSPNPLMPGVRYRWAVRAKINGNATGWSPVYSFVSRSSIAYPVALGNRWEYRWQHSWVGTDIGDRSGYYVVEITRAETGWPVNPVWVFEETWYNFDTDTLARATTYYHVAVDGLYLVGYDGAGEIHPVSGDGSYRVGVNDRAYRSLGGLLVSSGRARPANSASPEDIILETPPKLVLEYPVMVGAEWTYRTDNPWRIEKSIDDYEVIDVPAGSFGCFVVRSLEDMDGDGEFYESPLLRDYVAEAGLVRRSDMMLDVMLVDTLGHPIGLVDIIDEYQLVAWE